MVFGNRLEAQRREWQCPRARDGGLVVTALRAAAETSITGGACASNTTGLAPIGFETGVECQDCYAEAVIAFTRTVSRDTRREAVLGFRTPLVTALLRADVASRRVALASSGFLAVIAS